MRYNLLKNDICKIKKGSKKLSPPIIILLSFLITIIAGSLLLMLPFARKTDLSYLDLLFTSTSAVCVVGLTVFNIAENFTYYGQIILMLLIQIGGIGFMTVATLIFIFFGKKITLKERITLSEAYNQDNLQGIVKLTKYIILFTLIIEVVGAILLSFYFVPNYGFLKGVFYAFFHSVSSFCNSGISLVDFSDSAYSGNILLNLSMMSLIFLGGIGFAVIKDIINSKRPSKFSFNTKVVLYTSLVLLTVSTILIAASEWNNSATIGQENIFGKLLRSLFQSVTARTAGFNTITQADMTDAGKLVTIINMFIGASPASTGGGIKTSTFFLLILLFISGLKGQEKEITVFGKSIAFKTAHKAMIMFIYAVLTVILFSVLLVMAESGNLNITLETAVFEVVSAFATVGLSLGITPMLSAYSKILIIVLMIIGRLGFLVIGLFIFLRKQKEGILIKHPEVKIIIG